jgi:uncharacterized membrane protein
MFVFVLPAGLVTFLHPFQFVLRLPGPLPLIFMMVFLSSSLKVFLGASLLLHFIVSSLLSNDAGMILSILVGFLLDFIYGIR